MAISVAGVTYYTTKDIVDSLSITRQTLWRWRLERKVPIGRRFRDKQLLFTKSEFEIIKDFANRIEPTSVASPQLELFNNFAYANTIDRVDEQ